MNLSKLYTLGWFERTQSVTLRLNIPTDGVN